MRPDARDAGGVVDSALPLDAAAIGERLETVRRRILVDAHRRFAAGLERGERRVPRRVRSGVVCGVVRRGGGAGDGRAGRRGPTARGSGDRRQEETGREDRSHCGWSGVIVRQGMRSGSVADSRVEHAITRPVAAKEPRFHPMIDPQLLARAGPFATLAMPALDALAARATERAFTPNEMLFRAGAPARGLFVVTEGRVRVLRAMAGRQHVVHVEGVGGTLGEVPLFAGGGFPATAIAAEPTRCVIIGREAIGAAMASDPAVAWVLLERLALRVRELVDRLDRLAGQSVTSRLATLILERDGGRG